MFSQKSILARLLANENISVEQGNFETAWFEPKSRRLGLPGWSNMSKDMYDLLVGHEISHALHTPADGWHDADVTIPGCPKSFLNVTEDVRIEKLVLRKYPGLVANFKRGYGEMLERDFFGIKGKDVNELFFMDRLNIKAKCRDLVDVAFTDEEMYFVNKVYAAETWKEVIEVTREIYDWLKKNNQNELDKMQTGNGASGGSAEVDMTQEEFDAMMANSEKSEESNGDASTTIVVNIVDSEDGEETDQNSSGGSNSSDTEGEEGDGNGKKPAGDRYNPDLEKVSTSEASEKMLKTLADDISNGGRTIYLKELSKGQFNSIVTPFAELVQHRKKTIPSSPFPRTAYVKWLAEQKPIVSNMVKEFEMRKAAYRSVRAKTSTRGTLDVNKLHSYKYSDQLFKQYTTLADGKNHGMVMLIDYSGSMHGVMSKVLKQLLQLVMFCKRVNIPFDVYGFTSALGPKNEKTRSHRDYMTTTLSWENTSVFQLISSSLSRQDYELAFSTLFAQAEAIVSNYYSDWFSDIERLNSTPLNTSLIVMAKVIEEFRKKNRVQKMTFITLTDGESDYTAISTGRDIGSRLNASAAREMILPFNGKPTRLPTTRNSQVLTEAIIKAIRANDVACINYFIGAGREFNVYLPAKVNGKSARSALNADGVIVADDNQGYNRRFFVKVSRNTMNADAELDYEIDDNMSVKKIAQTFSKAASNRKSGRIVAQKFAEIVS